MGDNLFQNAADEGTQLGQANVKSLQTGADMMGDIFEKTADSNLKEGENQRQQQKLPYDIENIKSEVQQRLAETQLKQQQYKSAQLTAMGSAFQESTKLLNNVSAVDPAYLNTPTVENQMQRIATLKSQMGIPTTVEDVKAMMKDDGLRAKMQSAGSLFMSADPKDVGDAITQAGKMGINIQDMYAEKGVDQLRNVQKDREKNEADVMAANLRGPGVAYTPDALAAKMKEIQEKNKGAQSVADTKAESEKTKITQDMRDKVIPAQVKGLGEDAAKIKSKWDPEITHLQNLNNFVNFDPKSKTGVLQIGAADSFVKSLTGTGRINEQQLNALGTSQGGLMKIGQSLLAHIGVDVMPDKNGAVSMDQLGKFLTPDQMKTMGKAGQMMQSNIQRSVVKEAYPVYKQYEDLKTRASNYGAKVPDTILDPELHNLVKQYDDQHHFDPSSGSFNSPTTAPTQKTSGNKSTKPATFTLSTSEQKFKAAVKKAYPKMTDAQINVEIKKRRTKQ